MTMSSDSGWINHALGLAELIHELGPEMFIKGDCHAVFEANRFNTILACLATSKSTFLAEPRWKTIPWSNAPGAKDLVQCFLDLMAELPGLKVSIDRNMDLVGDYQKASWILGKLRAWREIWDGSHQSPVIDKSTTPTQESMPCTLRPSLRYSFIQDANAVCNCDAAIILTVEMMTTAMASSTSLNNTDVRLEVAAAHALSLQAAVEICQSVDFQLRGQYSMIGQFISLYPLRMAWKAFSGSSTPEGAWVGRKIASFAQSKHHWQVASQALKQTKG